MLPKESFTDAKNSKVRASLSSIIGPLHLATLDGHVASKLQLTQRTLLKNSKLKIYIRNAKINEDTKRCM